MEVSCGDDEVELDIYGSEMPKAASGDVSVHTLSKDPSGKDVTGTFEAIKMDGGYSEISWHNKQGGSKWYAMDWLNMEESKSWIRRRANGLMATAEGAGVIERCTSLRYYKSSDCDLHVSPVVRQKCYDLYKMGGGGSHHSLLKWCYTTITGKPGGATGNNWHRNKIHWDAKALNVPAWKDTKSPVCPNMRSGKYRPNLSSKTNTCCPKKGLPGRQGNFAPNRGTYQGVPKPTDWRATFSQMADPCYRGIYGETKTCKSNLELRVLECAGCKCKASNGKDFQSIVVTIKHNLLTDVPGCMPWFTLVDSGTRAFISSIRKDIVNEKLKQCMGGRSGGSRDEAEVTKD